jgi:hypothetical protein
VQGLCTASGWFGWVFTDDPQVASAHCIWRRCITTISISIAKFSAASISTTSTDLDRTGSTVSTVWNASAMPDGFHSG